ncbi:hypothetical protein TNCV_2348171 [Trichonephila clavipes]|uniref:Uncharacterized protein n=1 Tax=Trichonephila clavipes TaxID=2585209 RepID=A0A8X6SLV9_TRICX|nr:hypothetical protein TNCV_2348171 [Trichonephila clavipes]
MNIADLLSVRCSPRQMLHSRWWDGPSWLKQNSEYWPEKNILLEDWLKSQRNEGTVKHLFVGKERDLNVFENKMIVVSKHRNQYQQKHSGNVQEQHLLVLTESGFSSRNPGLNVRFGAFMAIENSL